MRMIDPANRLSAPIVEVTEAPTKSPAEMRNAILALEATILAMPQIEIPIEHYFVPGIYLRQMTMPAGAVITGKIHRTEHYCILAKGEATLVTESGRKNIQAPMVIHSLPGVKRAIHSHSEVVWINVHHNPTNERDLNRVDEIFVVDTFDQLPDFEELKSIQGGE